MFTPHPHGWIILEEGLFSPRAKFPPFGAGSCPEPLPHKATARVESEISKNRLSPYQLSCTKGYLPTDKTPSVALRTSRWGTGI